MKRLVLTAQEARDLAAETLTEIRRPFKNPDHMGEPPAAIHPDGSGKGWIAWWGRGPFTEETTRSLYPGNQGFLSPFGAPGALLWCAETWGVGCRPDPFDGWRDGIEYKADEQWLVDENDLLPLHNVKVPDDADLCEYEGKGWQPAITMPQWASRHTLRLTAVHAERIGDVWNWIGAVERAEGAK